MFGLVCISWRFINAHTQTALNLIRSINKESQSPPPAPHILSFTRWIIFKIRHVCDRAQTKNQLLSDAYSSARSLYAHCTVCHTQNIHKVWTYSIKHFTTGTFLLGTEEETDSHLHNLEAEGAAKMERKTSNCESLHIKEYAANRNLSNCTRNIKLRNLDSFMLTTEFKWET
jgi:hypothetical protein